MQLAPCAELVHVSFRGSTPRKITQGQSAMRSVLSAFFLAIIALPGWSAVLAEPGTEAERVSRGSAVEGGHGAVVISIRSELYLDDPLHVYFLREGGNIANDADVVRFERRQGFFAFGNDTVEYKIRAFQLRPGSYRLVAHGMNCPNVPAEDERCLIDVQGLTGGEQLSRPSRGYGAIAPRFEIEAGKITYAGDFALTARNTIEWSEIPYEEMNRMHGRFSGMAVMPEPIIPGEFRLRFGLNPRSYEDDKNRRY